jgi:hypothetical protein
MNELLDKVLLAVLIGLPALYGGSWLLGSGLFARMASLAKGKPPEPASADALRLRLLDEARDLYDQSPAECRAPLETVILSLLRTNQVRVPQTEVQS